MRPNLVLPLLLVMSVLATVAVACGGGDSDAQPFDPEISVLGEIAFSSPAFDDGDDIPVEFTCDGANSSPPLRWAELPTGTRSIAIILDDPDAPGQIYRHWSVYNIPSGTHSLSAGQMNTSALKDSTRQGQNSFGSTGYGGPCPPTGQEHEYLFFIYALSEQLALDENASPLQVSEAIRGLVVGTGSFSGMYVRR